MSVVPAIPMSQIVSVNPSVLSAGGTALDLNGLILTTSTRPPIGTVQAFPDANSVGKYFGPTSHEAALATIYFLGFDNSNKKPGNLFFWQYAWQEPVGAYLRGGNVSGLTLAQLQALNGSLTVTINGVPVTASISLAAATSFSNAAEIIQSALGITGFPASVCTGSIAGGTMTISAVGSGPQRAVFVGSIAGGTMTVTSMTSGYISVGDLVTGTGVAGNTTVTGLGSGQGGVGTYAVSPSQTAGSQVITDYSPNGAIAIGDVVAGTGILANTYVAANITGFGGVGTYGISPAQNALSQPVTIYGPGVEYDPILGAFIIHSSTLGVGSTISFGSGALATSLLLTQALGAVTSQGAAQSTPAGDLGLIIDITQNWAQFMTAFEPSDADKIAFAAWTNGQNNRYAYAMVDTSIVNTQSTGPAPAPAAILLANYSGTSLIYEDPTVDVLGQEIAAFVLGYGASIDFTQIQGRATAAFKSQSGLAPQVFKGSISSNLQNNKINFYGDFTTANQAFTWYYPGSVSGPFAWLDSYLNQIWLNNQLQLALAVLLGQVRTIPYNQAGYALISAACKDPIFQALNAGVIQPGVPLSQAQIAEVNQQAGLKIDGIISTAGWYLQVLPASAQVRAARGSPPVTLWYADGGSVQKINLASIEVQ